MCLTKAVGDSSTQYNVLVVDNNKKSRNRICAAIHADAELAVWGQAGSVSEVCDLLEYGLPALALIELELPDGRGEAIITELSKNAPYVRTLVLAILGKKQSPISADESGALEYLDKTDDVKKIVRGIKRALNSRASLLPEFSRSEKTVNGKANSTNTPPLPDSKAKKVEKSKLTPAEIDILNYIAKGFTGPEIAAITGRSVNTVPVHMKSIYRKLSVSGRGEAVFRALQLGLIGENCG